MCENHTGLLDLLDMAAVFLEEHGAIDQANAVYDAMHFIECCHCQPDQILCTESQDSLGASDALNHGAL